MNGQREERRAMQRDWLGHAVQLVGMLLVIGVPLLVWGVSMNTTVATMALTLSHHDKDIADVKQIQTLATGQIIDVNKVLIRIDTQLEGIREAAKPKR